MATSSTYNTNHFSPTLTEKEDHSFANSINSVWRKLSWNWYA